MIRNLNQILFYDAMHELNSWKILIQMAFLDENSLFSLKIRYSGGGGGGGGPREQNNKATRDSLTCVNNGARRHKLSSTSSCYERKLSQLSTGRSSTGGSTMRKLSLYFNPSSPNQAAADLELSVIRPASPSLSCRTDNGSTAVQLKAFEENNFIF